MSSLYFSVIKDPRVERRKLHKLLDIIVIAILERFTISYNVFFAFSHLKFLRGF